MDRFVYGVRNNVIPKEKNPLKETALLSHRKSITNFFLAFASVQNLQNLFIIWNDGPDKIR